jgi:hypothetical protein
MITAVLDVEVFVNVQKEASLFGAGLIARRTLDTEEHIRSIISGQIRRMEPGWIPNIPRETMLGWYRQYCRWVEAAKG